MSGISSKNVDDDDQQQQQQHRVRFGTVAVHEFGMTLGSNPATSLGPTLRLETDCQLHKPVVSVDEYERTKKYGRVRPIWKGPRGFYLSYYARQGILKRAGFAPAEIEKAERRVKLDRLKRKVSQYQSFPILYVKSIKVQMARRTTKRFVKLYRKEREQEETAAIGGRRRQEQHADHSVGSKGSSSAATVLSEESPRNYHAGARTIVKQ